MFEPLAKELLPILTSFVNKTKLQASWRSVMLLCFARRFPSAGFTLIELLIVVAIISILAAMAIPNMLEARTRSMATGHGPSASRLP